MQPRIFGSVVDQAGTPVRGSVVSNGIESFLVHSAGRFEIPCGGPFIWVCPPSGWGCATWWVRADSDLFDFVLTPISTKSSGKIAHLSDLHLTMRPAPDAPGDGSSSFKTGNVLERLGDAIRRTSADLILISGDVTDRGTTAELQAAVNQLRRIGPALRMVPGNHDHYGHRDEPEPDETVSVDSELGSGSVTRWERIVGPRWWSINHGGFHIAGLDWFSSRTGIDATEQLRWLTSDLALLPAGTPLILVVHDQDAELFRFVRGVAPDLRVVAALSGHWHASRGIEVDGTVHLSTGPALFGGRDWSPPQFRTVQSDGDGIRVRTISTGRIPPRTTGFPVEWRWGTLPAKALSCHLTAHPEGVVCTSADQDRQRGQVSLLEGSTGITSWSWAAPDPVSARASVDDNGAVFVQTTAGTVVRLDDGDSTWSVRAANPIGTRILTRPLPTGENTIVVEGPGSFSCLDSRDGGLLWTRALGDARAHFTHQDGIVAGGLVLVPLTGPEYGLTALKSHDGSTAWRDGEGIPRPESSPVAVGDGTALIKRSRGVVERLELATGAPLWRTWVGGDPSSAAPVCVAGVVAVVTGDGVVHLLDLESGLGLQHHFLPCVGGHAPYHSDGPAVGNASVAVGDDIHIFTVTGEWWRVNPSRSHPERVGRLPMTITSPPIACGDFVVVASSEGTVVACAPSPWPAHRKALTVVL